MTADAVHTLRLVGYPRSLGLLVVTCTRGSRPPRNPPRSSSSIASSRPGTAPSVPLFGFIFLVALGVDYNIFLTSRVRKKALRHGTRTGMLRGLITTGGVITSAGVVLAAVFAVLTVLPLVQFIEIGIVVALGVLIDTFLVAPCSYPPSPTTSVTASGGLAPPARLPT